jgi:tRNA A-37 threonylcarbamoyl transferase component Bud32
VPGKLASEFPHTPEFVKRIHAFCLGQIDKTKPWYHGDWTLSNMIINGDTITMIDWDNLGQYPEEEAYAKLNNDLKSAFGELYVF